MQNTKRGFTLIELLVVIAIIGILSSIVLASLNSARQKARDTRRLADVRTIQTALEQYNDTNGAYPAALTSLAPTYIQAVPTDPQTGSSYTYVGVDTNSSAASCESYYLGSKLEVSTNNALNSDNDDAALPSGSAACTGSTAFSSMADPVYAVRP